MLKTCLWKGELTKNSIEFCGGGGKTDVVSCDRLSKYKEGLRNYRPFKSCVVCVHLLLNIYCKPFVFFFISLPALVEPAQEI